MNYDEIILMTSFEVGLEKKDELLKIMFYIILTYFNLLRLLYTLVVSVCDCDFIIFQSFDNI